MQRASRSPPPAGARFKRPLHQEKCQAERCSRVSIMRQSRTSSSVYVRYPPAVHATSDSRPRASYSRTALRVRLARCAASPTSMAHTGSFAIVRGSLLSVGGLSDRLHGVILLLEDILHLVVADDAFVVVHSDLPGRDVHLDDSDAVYGRERIRDRPLAVLTRDVGDV